MKHTTSRDIKEKRPWIPRGVYNVLSSSNKVSLWAIAISCIVTVFTFWLGLSYQYMLVSDKKEESQKAIHYTLVKEVQKHKRAYDEQVLDIVSKSITADMSLIEKSPYFEYYLKNEILTNWNDILDRISKSIAISERAKFYLPEDKFRTISFNNCKLSVFLSHAYSAQNRIDRSTEIINDFDHKNQGDSIFFEELKDSMNIYIKQYENNKYIINSPQFDINSYMNSNPFGLWLCTESCMYNINNLNDETIRGILISRKNIISIISVYLADNYRAIKSEIEPVNKNDGKASSVKTILSGPGIYVSIISLFLIIIVSILIWWLFIWIIFRKSEIPNKLSNEDWDESNSKENELAILATISRIYTNQQFIIRELEKKVNKTDCYAFGSSPTDINSNNESEEEIENK